MKPFAILIFIMAASISLDFASQCLAADAFEKELATWLTENKESTADLVRWADLQVKPGAAFKTNETVLIHLPNWPADGKLMVPRLNNPLGKVYLLGSPQQEITVKPEVREWQFSLPTELPVAACPVVVIKTVGAPHWAKAPVRLAPNDDGVLVLAAHDAETHGELIRYEPQPHKNTVGYWANPKDWFGWSLRIPAAGKYKVRVLQGCGQGQGGSEVSIRAIRSTEPTDVKPLRTIPPTRFTVEDTGHFQNFVPRDVGTLSFAAAADYSLEVRCDRLAAKAVMDVREIRLVPLTE